MEGVTHRVTGLVCPSSTSSSFSTTVCSNSFSSSPLFSSKSSGGCVSISSSPITSPWSPVSPTSLTSPHDELESTDKAQDGELEAVMFLALWTVPTDTLSGTAALETQPSSKSEVESWHWIGSGNVCGEGASFTCKNMFLNATLLNSFPVSQQ